MSLESATSVDQRTANAGMTQSLPGSDELLEMNHKVEQLTMVSVNGLGDPLNVQSSLSHDLLKQGLEVQVLVGKLDRDQMNSGGLRTGLMLGHSKDLLPETLLENLKAMLPLEAKLTLEGSLLLMQPTSLLGHLRPGLRM